MLRWGEDGIESKRAREEREGSLGIGRFCRSGEAPFLGMTMASMSEDKKEDAVSVPLTSRFPGMGPWDFLYRAGARQASMYLSP